MAWSAKVIEIFLSSPADVSRERALVRRTIDEWNQRRGTTAGCIFSVLGWETVTAEVEGYAQGSINEQIGDEYDVMLGLMWTRFGTPTGQEESGTFEEFKRALDRKRGGNAVRISFYFKQAVPVDLDHIDPEQLAKVRRFKQFIRDEGGLTGDFSDDESLRRSIDLLLERIVRELDKYPLAIAPTQQLPKPKTARVEGEIASSGQVASESEADDEVGILDLFERVDKLGALFETEMLDWSHNLSSLGDCAITATAELEELAQFGTPPASEVRRVIDRVTEDFNKNADFVEERSPVITGQLAEFTGLISAQVRLFPDFDIDVKVKAKRLQETIDLSEAMQFAYDNTKGLIDSVAELPRMSTAFNASRQRLVRAYEPFLRELELSKRAIEDAIKTMRAALPTPAEEVQSAPAGKPPRRTTQKPRRRRSRKRK